jgi:hemolysin activation/secretion protein
VQSSFFLRLKTNPTIRWFVFGPMNRLFYKNTYIPKLCWAWSLLCLLGGGGAIAQPNLSQPPTLPNPIPVPSLIPLPSERLPPPEDLLKLPPTPSLESPKNNRSFQTLTVRRFNVVGSTVFSETELHAATKSFLNRPLTFAEFLKARSAITQLYLDRGYFTSGAYIPTNQTIRDGVVTIAVLEGGIEEIRVSGNRSLRARYIRDRLQPAAKRPFNVNRFLEALQRLKQDPLVQNISAEILPGTNPGMNLLAIQVKQTPDRSGYISLHNHKSSVSGDFARQVRLKQANLTGYGDIFNASYTNAEGSHEFSLGYTLPINIQNGVVGVSYGQSHSTVIQKPFDALNLQSTSRNLTVFLRQPLLNKPNRQFAVGVAFSRQESETTFLGDIPFSLPESGSDVQGRSRITELSLFQEWTQRSNRSVLAVRSNLGIGLDWGATRNPSSPDGRFVTWQGQAEWLYAIRPDTVLTLRSTVQLADRPLPSQALIGLGGAAALRGYPEGFFLVDQAIFNSLDISIPLYRSQNRTHRVSVVPFVDVGYGWNVNKPSSTQDRWLVATGLGLRYVWSDRIALEINWGIPLVGIPSEQISAGFEDSRISVMLDTRLF